MDNVSNPNAFRSAMWLNENTAAVLIPVNSYTSVTDSLLGQEGVKKILSLDNPEIRGRLRITFMNYYKKLKYISGYKIYDKDQLIVEVTTVDNRSVRHHRQFYLRAVKVNPKIAIKIKEEKDK